jgi:hypothetical protein
LYQGITSQFAENAGLYQGIASAMLERLQNQARL